MVWTVCVEGVGGGWRWWWNRISRVKCTYSITDIPQVRRDCIYSGAISLCVCTGFLCGCAYLRVLVHVIYASICYNVHGYTPQNACIYADPCYSLCYALRSEWVFIFIQSVCRVREQQRWRQRERERASTRTTPK